jgi:hypothetical protein
MGGAFAVYAYSGLDGDFDYGPYLNGMRAAARPGTIDSHAPSVTAAPMRRAGDTVTLSGTAADNMAIRTIRWRVGGKHGIAAMRWTVTDGNSYSRYQWQMDWTASVPAPSGQVVTVTAQDLKGNTAAVSQTAP